MLENFIRDEETLLSGNVLIIALIYSTTFCAIMDLEEIYIQDPTREARPRYLSYGFAQVWSDHNKTLKAPSLGAFLLIPLRLSACHCTALLAVTAQP